MNTADTGLFSTASDLQGWRVLLTGSNGFTGRYLREYLHAAGCEVVGTSSNPAGADDCHIMDLRDPESVREVVETVRPDAVIHLAALAFVGHGDPNDFYAVNLMGTRNLLEALTTAERPLKKVILASSANVYGNAHSGSLSEEAAPAPANDYAVSKVAMEYMASLWADRLPLLITRPFNYTGVGQETRYLIAKIVDHFRRRASVIELGNLDIARDFSDVRAVAAAYGDLLASDAQSETVNICSGTSYTLRDIIALCETISGHRIDVTVNPAFVRANDVKTLSGNPARLQQLVPDWRVIPLEETLRWMLHSAAD